MNLDTEENTFAGQAFCNVLERDVHVVRGMDSKKSHRCTGRYLWEYRLEYIYYHCSKALALIWYRALTWYSLRLRPLRTHFEPWKAVGTRAYCPVTSRGSSGVANDRAGDEYQVRARYQIRANALLDMFLSSFLVHFAFAAKTRTFHRTVAVSRNTTKSWTQTSGLSTSCSWSASKESGDRHSLRCMSVWIWIQVYIDGYSLPPLLFLSLAPSILNPPPLPPSLLRISYIYIYIYMYMYIYIYIYIYIYRTFGLSTSCSWSVSRAEAWGDRLSSRYKSMFARTLPSRLPYRVT